MGNLYECKKAGGVSPSGTKQITISATGTTTEDVAAYASAEITTSGLVKPTGNKALSYTTNGNRTGIDVADYETVSVSVNVSASAVMPNLTYSSPIYTFGSNDSWTATQDCVIFGGFIFSQTNYITIDGTRLNPSGSDTVGPLMIKSGSVVAAVGSRNTVYDTLAAFAVSSGYYPRLNYGSPLHSFTGTDETWTATKDCYLVFSIYANQTDYISIDGYRISPNQPARLYGPIKIKSGQVIKAAGSRNNVYDRIYALDTY